MKVLAIDYGERRTGVAVSDDIGITAQGLPTIEVKDEGEIAGRILALAEETGAGLILLGLPLNMDGSESEKSRKVREIGAGIEQRAGVSVHFWDERMSSLQAHRVMHELGAKPSRDKAAVDRISATLMLQEFLKTLP